MQTSHFNFYYRRVFSQKIIYFFIKIVSIAQLLWLTSCHVSDSNPEPVADTTSANVALRWSKMSLYIAEHTPGNTPTYASRGFGYIGLTMYESIVAGFPEYKSMAGQATQLMTLPKADSTQKYNWVLALNAGQAFIHKAIYEQTSTTNKAKIDSLEKVIFDAYKSEKQDVVERSVIFGQNIAKAIYEWSKTDGGHQGYNRNFSNDYSFPSGQSYWEPPFFSQSATQLPLHPFWGENRTFANANHALPIPDKIPFSTDKNSAYYAQFLEVYQVNNNLTQTEKEIALFWGDDPSRTFTPPGHSYSIARIAVRESKAGLIKAAQTFAMVGMAISDAFATCWRAKYKYHAERPSSYIRANISPNWVSFWPEPPFPAFYSGHAVQSSATATVLTALYGENFKYTDDSHQGRGQDPLTMIEYKNRTFNSFREAAEESAHSRLLGGIHCRSDNETGLREGVKIGQNIVGFRWRK